MIIIAITTVKTVKSDKISLTRPTTVIPTIIPPIERTETYLRSFGILPLFWRWCMFRIPRKHESTMHRATIPAGTPKESPKRTHIKHASRDILINRIATMTVYRSLSKPVWRDRVYNIMAITAQIIPAKVNCQFAAQKASPSKYPATATIT